MVEAMPFGSVIVDLAAASGGNVEVTVPGKVIDYKGKTIIGYTNIESRMASTASSLFAGNVTNLLLSMEDKKDKSFIVNLEDPAVRSMLIVNHGELLPTYVPPVSTQPVVAKVEKKKEEIILTNEQIKELYTKNAMYVTAGSSTALALASMVPNAPMMSTFALSCWVGNSCVAG